MGCKMIKESLSRGAQRWYVSVLALYYALMCSATFVLYIWHDIKGDFVVPYHQQALCFIMAVAALLYVYKPVVSYSGMMLVTTLTIISILISGATGAGWHIFTLIIMLYASVPGKVQSDNILSEV